jgi:hypothetical protein
MSEYQYHEWQTVERVLTPEEQAEVENLSSHIEVSSIRWLPITGAIFAMIQGRCYSTTSTPTSTWRTGERCG